MAVFTNQTLTADVQPALAHVVTRNQVVMYLASTKQIRDSTSSVGAYIDT